MSRSDPGVIASRAENAVLAVALLGVALGALAITDHMSTMSDMGMTGSMGSIASTPWATAA